MHYLKMAASMEFNFKFPGKEEKKTVTNEYMEQLTIP